MKLAYIPMRIEGSMSPWCFDKKTGSAVGGFLPESAAGRVPAKRIIALGAVMIFLAVSTTWLLLRGERIGEIHQSSMQGRLLAEILAQAADPDFMGDEPARFLQVLECATRNGQVPAGALLDVDGRIITHTDLPRAGGKIDNVEIQGIGARPGSEEMKIALFGKTAGRVLLHPLYSESGTSGTVALLVADPAGGGLDAADLRFFLPAIILILAFGLMNQASIRWAVKPTSDFMNRISNTLEWNGGSEEHSASDPDGSMEDTVTRISDLIETKDGLVIKNRLLSYEKRRMSLILEEFPDGLVVVDSMQEVVFANRRALKILHTGMDAGEKGGINDSKELDRVVEETKKTGQTVIETTLGGVDRNLLVSRIPLDGSGGKSSGTLFTMRDVTAQKVSQRAQAEFLSQVSHELKAPLNTIITFVEELAENGDLPQSERRQYFNTLNSEANRMAQLISNLLQLSRIQLGNLSVRFSLVKPGALVSEQAESLRHHAEGSSIGLRVSVPQNLPALSGDKDLMAVAINNLISNAIKYTSDEGTVTVSAAAEKGGVAISVEDTGIGISIEDQARIFERFYRSENESVQSRSGTGLGLSLVREIVHAHGGKIEVKSVIGEGSCFRLWLPAREAGLKMNIADAPAPAAPEREITRGEKTSPHSG